MRARWHGHEVALQSLDNVQYTKPNTDTPVITAIDSLNESRQLGRIQLFLAKVDNVHCHIVLFQFLSKFDQSRLVFCERAGNKNDNALSLVLVLSMFQDELF